MAALPDDEKEAAAAQIEVATGSLKSKKSIPLTSTKPSKGSRSPKSERPGNVPANGRKDATKDTKGSSKSTPAVTSSTAREYKVKGQSVTVHSDAETGVEYYCRKIRKRLWADGEGWVVRSMPFCF
jgi:hypothetical protein